RLQPEIDGHRQILDQRLQLRRADAGDVLVPLLAVLAVGLVLADPALDRVRHALGRQAQLQARAELDLAAFEHAADMGYVSRDRVLADFDRRAREADAGDVVLAAAVRAAADLDVQLASQLVGDVQRLDPLLHRLVQPHRAGDPELARVGSRARHDVVDLPRARVAQVHLRQRLPQVVHALLAHPAQDEVLLHGRTRVAAGVGA